MSRYIDADRLLLELYDLIDEFSELDENGLHNERWCGIMDSKGIIVNAPSIDIVRCKECKRYEEDSIGWYCDRYKCTMQADDFCSYGESKESE